MFQEDPAVHPDYVLTVTAERTERSIMDTATSVVVLDDDTIEQRPAMKSVNDVTASIPNVVAPSTGNIAPAVTMATTRRSLPRRRLQ